MTKEFYNNVTIQMMGDDETPVSNELIDATLFFQCAFSLNLARIVAAAEPEINKANLGHLWGDVLPRDGKYAFEIATVLPYYLPSLGDDSEYMVKVDGHPLVVSLRMLQCFFSEAGNQSDPLQYFLVHRRGLPNLMDQKQFIQAHPVPLRTFVIKPFEVEGTNAEQILQENFLPWVKEFAEDISQLLDAMRAASPKDAKHLLPQAGTPFLPVFWVCVRGEDNKTGIEQFAGDMPSAAFRSLTKFDEEAIARVHEYLADGASITVQESALALATTYLHYGYLGLSLVQVCIACESALAQCYESFLTSRGVSKTKYKDAERDITFSQLLNLHLAAARDLTQLQDRENILSRLNFARNCRNDMVHKGQLERQVTSEEVKRAIDAARALIEFLSKAAQSH